MSGVQRDVTTEGLVAIDGRTLTLVARTRAVHVGSDGRGALHIRSRPTHVEVLDADGRRQVLRIRDTERVVLAAIAFSAVGIAAAARILRARRTA